MICKNPEAYHQPRTVSGGRCIALVFSRARRINCSRSSGARERAGGQAGQAATAMHDLKNENRNPVAASGRGPLDDQFPTDRTTAAARHSATRRPPSFAKRLLQCCYIVLLGGRQRRRRSTFYARATSVTPTMQYLGHLHTRGQE